MKYLVDSNVLSELTKPVPQRLVLDWLTANVGEFAVDSVILGEMFAGILALPRGRKRSKLEQWFTVMENTVQCIAWDKAVGLRWAQLIVDLKRKGLVLPILDAMISATALTHNLTVVTRNVRDFGKAGVTVFNPF